MFEGHEDYFGHLKSFTEEFTSSASPGKIIQAIHDIRTVISATDDQSPEQRLAAALDIVRENTRLLQMANLVAVGNDEVVSNLLGACSALLDTIGEKPLPSQLTSMKECAIVFHSMACTRKDSPDYQKFNELGNQCNAIANGQWENFNGYALQTLRDYLRSPYTKDSRSETRKNLLEAYLDPTPYIPPVIPPTSPPSSPPDDVIHTSSPMRRVAIISDVHVNRPLPLIGEVGNRTEHTGLTAPRARGLLALPRYVDDVVIAGDLFDPPAIPISHDIICKIQAGGYDPVEILNQLWEMEKVSKKQEATQRKLEFRTQRPAHKSAVNDREDPIKDIRYNPIALLDQLCAQTNDRGEMCQIHLVPGNHDGSDVTHTVPQNLHKHSPEHVIQCLITEALQKLQKKHPNLHIEDSIKIGDILVMHGHEFLDDMKRTRNSDRKFFTTYHIKDPAQPGAPVVEARTEEAVAQAICNVTQIRQFIDEKVREARENQGSGEYIPPQLCIVYGHTHQRSDTRIDLTDDTGKPMAAVRIINLGCMLPKLPAHFQLAALDEKGAIKAMQPLDLGGGIITQTCQLMQAFRMKKPYLHASTLPDRPTQKEPHSRG